MTWETVPLGELIELKYGKALKAEDRIPGQFPVVGSGGIVGTHTAAITTSPTIVVGRKGSIGSLTYLDEGCWAIDTAYFVARKRDVHLRWLYWMMGSLRLGSMNKSAAIPGLNRDDAYRARIPLPPLPEQRRIAAILDEADALRTKVKRIPQLNRDFEDAYFLRSFGDPRSVAARPLLEMVHAQSGGTPSKVKPEYWAGTIPWVSPKDMKTRNLFDAIDHISDTAVEQTTLRLLPPDTVAIVVRGMILVHTIPVARLRVASTINQDMKALIPKESIDPAFLAAAIRLQSNSILGAVSVAGHGTRRLDAEALQAIRVPIATLDQQTAFGATVATAEQMGASMSASARALDTLFASLQHRAFRGEL